VKLPQRTNSVIHECILAALLIVVLIAAAWLEPTFMTVEAQLELSTHAIELALLSLPVTLIIISGGIDLSVGSSMALSAVVLGLLFEAGAPIYLCALAAILTGTTAGALNGFFIAKIKVDPLIVTLATLAAFRGLAEGISLGHPISGFPKQLLHLGSGTLATIPIPALILLLICITTAALVWKSVSGFRVYAIGGNELAARYAGLPVNTIKLALYTLSGTASGLAAILYVARRNTAKADIGTGIELEVITAVVLGGTNIFGGRGTIIGTLLGVALIHEVRELVDWHWHHDELILIVIGTILIASVLLNNLASSRRSQ